MDLPLKPLLVLALVGLSVGLAAAIVFAWSSPASKTIAISAATLFGAALLFLLQLAFELRASEESDFVSLEFTVDRAQPLVRQWRHSASGAGWRLEYEHDASEWLAKNSPTAFTGDRERLTHDFTLAEILLFFARQEFDWQLAKTTFVGSTFGTQVMTQRVSKKRDCTEMSPAKLAEALTRAGNVLAGYELWAVGGAVCFPPGTNRDS